MNRRSTALVLAILAIGILAPAAAQAQAKKKFTVAVSIYAGWMPWYYAKDTGIIGKWAKSRGIEVDVSYMDYVPSLEAFVAQKADACLMTNMEMLDMPCSSGIDSTAIIVGDYSNGNDAILVRNNLALKDLKGQKIYLVERTVSHYLLVRALEQSSLVEKDVSIVNTSDSDIAPAFVANKSEKVVVTWNPMVMNIEQTPGVSRIFDSSKIPGEVLDLMVVNTKVLKDNPALGEVLVGAWYEVMGIMSQRGKAADDAMSQMAKRAGCSLTEYKSQLKTTAMFWTPQSGIDYISAPEAKEKMAFVRKFCFEHGLLGKDAKSVDSVGISYPDGTIQGDKAKVRLRFDTGLMKRAAAGEIKR